MSDQKYSKERPEKPGRYLMAESIGLEDTDNNLKSERVVEIYIDNGKPVLNDWLEFGSMYIHSLPKKREFWFCPINIPAPIE